MRAFLGRYMSLSLAGMPSPVTLGRLPAAANVVVRRTPEHQESSEPPAVGLRGNVDVGK